MVKRKNNMSVLEISQKAHERLEQILSSDKYLMISVNSGGCNGFSYAFEILNSIPNNANIVSENPNVCVLSSAIQYISGSILQFEKNDIGTSFFSIQNPNATSKCGCGNSFSTF